MSRTHIEIMGRGSGVWCLVITTVESRHCVSHSPGARFLSPTTDHRLNTVRTVSSTFSCSSAEC